MPAYLDGVKIERPEASPCSPVTPLSVVPRAAQKPSIGRMVWYWPSAGSALGGSSILSSQPFSATIVFVHSDGMVNLSVMDHFGERYPRSYVPLFNGEGERPKAPFCVWPSFKT